MPGLLSTPLDVSTPVTCDVSMRSATLRGVSPPAAIDRDRERATLQMVGGISLARSGPRAVDEHRVDRGLVKGEELGLIDAQSLHDQNGSLAKRTQKRATQRPMNLDDVRPESVDVLHDEVIVVVAKDRTSKKVALGSVSDDACLIQGELAWGRRQDEPQGARPGAHDELGVVKRRHAADLDKTLSDRLRHVDYWAPT